MWGYACLAACVGRGASFLLCWIFFSLTERTEVTEVLGARFRVHRTPSAYRVHRALLPKMAVRFCDIGWLNVSVGLCVFCSSVFFCEKENAPSMWKITLEICWGVFSLNLGRFFLSQSAQSSLSFLAHISSTQKASGIQSSQSIIAKEGCWMLGVRCWWLAKVGCKVLWNRLT